MKFVFVFVYTIPRYCRAEFYILNFYFFNCFCSVSSFWKCVYIDSLISSFNLTYSTAEYSFEYVHQNWNPQNGWKESMSKQEFST